MSRKLRRIGLIVGILATAVAVSVLLSTMRKQPPKKPVESRAMLVQVEELELVDTRFPVRSQGTVRPRTETVLSAEISGAIVEISPKFVPGGVFDPDEVLMRIDPSNYEVAVSQAERLCHPESSTRFAGSQLRLLHVFQSVERSEYNPAAGWRWKREHGVAAVATGQWLGDVWFWEPAEVVSSDEAAVALHVRCDLLRDLTSIELHGPVRCDSL